MRYNPMFHLKRAKASLSDISIDGDTAISFTENVEQRYLAYGWQVLHVKDGDQLSHMQFLERFSA